jgi:hypothetical protein
VRRLDLRDLLYVHRMQEKEKKDSTPRTPRREIIFIENFAFAFLLGALGDLGV